MPAKRNLAMSSPPRDWTAIDWTKVDTADAARWIAVLPLAATEQHGPHLPFETDVMIGKAYLARVREQLPGVIPATFLPIERIGISTEHIDFKGTQTLSTEAALAKWKSIGESVARTGVKKIVIVTSHGGNAAAMTLVAQDLRAHHGMLAVTTSWSRFGVPDGLFPVEELRHGIHGGAVETSIMLARYGEHVRVDAIADFPLAQHRDGKTISLAFDATSRAVRVAGAGSSSEWRGWKRDARLSRERRSAARARRARVHRIARGRR